MNRNARLHAVHEALRRHGEAGATAAALATALEVSTRTIKRDVLALQESGAPIWSRPGPGRGYRIDDSATMPPVAFTPAQAVATAVSLSVLPPGSPFGVDADAAGAKLRDTLGPAARQLADTLSSRIWVHDDPDERRTAASVLRAIEQSLTDCVTLSITYRDRNDETTRRTVEPILIAWANRHWHVVAHCRLRDGVRWFRFDRIERATVTREVYEPLPVSEVGQPPDLARPISRSTGAPASRR